MIPGAFRHRTELILLALFLIAGNWNLEALAYLLVAVVLAMVSAASLDWLLRVSEEEAGDTPAGRWHRHAHWAAAGMACVIIASIPMLLIGELAPPVLLIIFPLFLIYFAGPSLKAHVETVSVADLPSAHG